MPIFKLTDDIIFPPVELSEDNGLLAFGGDLSAERLLKSYYNGIFPWFDDEDNEILWWSPLERMVLYPSDVRISKSMRKELRKKPWNVTFDRAFEQVINNCSDFRKDSGTWITDGMIEAYINLNKLGFAHSVEVWINTRLVGGLYGVSIGNAFFGESMFSSQSNASKVALIYLSKVLQEKGFLFIDCQMYTEHLESMGANKIPRRDFLILLNKAINSHTFKDSWSRWGNIYNFKF